MLPAHPNEPAAPEAPWRKFHKLRIAWSVAWGIACVLLVVLWVRSLHRIDRLTWHYRNAEAFQVGTSPGQISIAAFVDQPVPSWAIHQLGRQWMTEWFQSMRLINGTMRWWFHVTSTNTHRSASIPDWFVILICCALGSIPWLRLQFSLRTLLIATALVAVALGLIMYTART
jgi:hypothetical protein